jgi:hypothetical protein
MNKYFQKSKKIADAVTNKRNIFYFLLFFIPKAYKKKQPPNKVDGCFFIIQLA